MHKGYAFIQFTNPFDARSACLGEDGRLLWGQTLGKDRTIQNTTLFPSSSCYRSILIVISFPVSFRSTIKSFIFTFIISLLVNHATFAPLIFRLKLFISVPAHLFLFLSWAIKGKLSLPVWSQTEGRNGSFSE